VGKLLLNEPMTARYALMFGRRRDD
jgi:hypothetical protein